MRHIEDHGLPPSVTVPNGVLVPPLNLNQTPRDRRPQNPTVGRLRRSDSERLSMSLPSLDDASLLESHRPYSFTGRSYVDSSSK